MTNAKITIDPLRLPFDIQMAMPGSKSHANRAIIAACLTDGETILEHATPCDDVALLVKNVQAMGYDVGWVDRDVGTLRVRGGDPRGPGRAHRTPVRGPPEGGTLDCGNAGTTLRFLTSLAAITPGEWVVTGDERMQKRPIGDLTSALRSLGADIEDTNGCPPLRIKGKQLLGGTVTLDASKSSQFLTSLLLIGPTLEQGLTINLTSDATSPTYIDLTQKVMKDFGVTIERSDRELRVLHTQYRIPNTPYPIEGDWSAVGAFLVLAELTGSRIDVPYLSPDSEQGDRKLPRVIASLRGAGNRTVDCTDFPDQVMNIGILAAHRNGKTTLTGAANLRHKECDRLAVLREELTKAGVDIAEHADGLIITGKAILKPATFDPHHDHRMAMCFAILGSLAKGMTIRDPECVSKSYPQFFEDLQKLNGSPKAIAIVGMRGAGKSNLAKQLARKLKLKAIDTDKVFIERHGPIGDYVKAHSWEAFRTEEENIVAECLKPGYVISLGGGAIESAATRQHLKRDALTIWMQVNEKEIVARLKKLKRPPLTDLPLEKEVPMILKKRTPLFAEVAAVSLPASIPFAGHASYLVRKLKAQCSW